MAETEQKTREEQRPVQVASDGVGPLLRRDFVLNVEGGECTPEEALLRARRDFERFSPDLLAKFTRSGGEGAPLEPGDTMHIRITGAGHMAVVVSHLDAQRLTLRTLEGHMEAGRITFAACRNEAGQLVLHIRTRSRIGDIPRLLEYWLGGKAAQRAVWVTFLNRWAEACGGQPDGKVQVTDAEVSDTAADRGETEGPTL